MGWGIPALGDECVEVAGVVGGVSPDPGVLTATLVVELAGSGESYTARPAFRPISTSEA